MPYIPHSIKKPWSKNIYNALEWISEELIYFQTDKIIDGEDKREVEERFTHRKWLMKKIEAFSKFF